MSSIVRLLVIVAILVLLLFLLRAYLGRTGSDVRFTPVADLPAQDRAVIDAALDRGEGVLAIKHYRASTGAGLAAAKAAVETHRDTRPSV